MITNKINYVMMVLCLASIVLHQKMLFFIIYYLIFLLNWKEILRKLYITINGVPFPNYYSYMNKAVVDYLFLKKYTVIYKLSRIKHSIEDLDPEDFWRMVKFLLTGIPLSKNILFSVIFMKNEEKYLGYFKIDLLSTEEKTNNYSDLTAYVEKILNIFHRSGISVKAVDYTEYLNNVLNYLSVKKRSKTYFLLSLALLSIMAAASAVSFTLLLYIIPAMFLLVLQAVLRVRINLKHVSFDSPVLYSSKNYSMESLLETSDLYDNAYSFYSTLASFEKVMIILSIRRRPVYEREYIGKKAYSLYEWGTALDKLSLLAKSKFLYEIVDKRIRRGEYVFDSCITLLSSKNEMEGIKSSLDSLGIKTKSDDTSRLVLLAM